jgi:hypothetical protein
MSQIVRCVFLPIAMLEQCVEVAQAPTQKRLFRPPVYPLMDFLHRAGTPGAELPDWSGYVVSVLLAYLEEIRQIDLLSGGEFAIAAQAITDATKTFHTVLTPSQRRFVAELTPERFDIQELQAYYEEFSDDEFPEAGTAMCAAMGFLAENLRRLPDAHVGLLSIR